MGFLLRYYSTLIFISFCLALGAQDQKKVDSLDNIIKEAKAVNDWEKLRKAHFEKGQIYFKVFDDILSLPEYLAVDSISKSHNRIDELSIRSKIYRAKISTYTFTEDGTDKANSLLFGALKEARSINNEDCIYRVYKELAYNMGLAKNYAEAKRYTDLAFPYYYNLKDAASISWLYHVYFNYYRAVDSLSKAEEKLKERVDYFRKSNDSIQLANALSVYAGHYSEKKDGCDLAVPYLEEAKAIYEKKNEVEIRDYLYILVDLAYCKAENNDYVSAYNYYEQAYNLRRKIVRQENNVKTRELESKYQAKERDQQIMLLESQNQLVEQQKRNQRYLLIAALGASLLVVGFLFFLFRNRQKTNHKLKELDEFKTNLFTNISHELRTPLTLISGPIEKQLNNPNMPNDAIEELNLVQNNADRLLNLIDQMTDLAKLDSGQIQLRVEQGDLYSFLSQQLAAFQYSATEKVIQLNHKLIKIDEAWFDKDVILKITSNLLSNAIKYAPNNTEVNVSALCKEGLFHFSVKNNVNNLKESDLDKLFNRFYQQDSSKKGMGVGLALVKELVSLHKGTIDIKRNTDSEIEFKVILPITKDKFTEKELISELAETQLDQVLETKTLESIDEDAPVLLIVEDDLDIQAFVKSIFEKDYQVLVAQNGKEGIDKAIASIPDMIISDVMMPITNGIELTETLKSDERTSHIPIILLTAKVGDANELEGITSGADDYITKPFKTKLLKTRVAKLIALRKQLQLRFSQEVILRPTDIAISSTEEQFLEKLQTVLDEKLVESNFTVEAFSIALSMSRMQLHRKLKALTGLSSSEFIRSQRLKLAADLLKNSDTIVSQVGYAVGFNDHSYFTKCFKKQFGCTPSDYDK